MTSGAGRVADFAACRAILREGSRSFHAASLLLPRAERGPVAALYAFCRVADHAVDRPGAGPADLERLRGRLGAVYAGRPADAAVDRAFARVVEDRAIPRAIPEALLEGFRWDLEGRRYETPPELAAYCARVASTVGVMMTIVLGDRRADTLRAAADLGLAMQLTNVARDVGEDAARGRLYLPRRWLREAGVDPETFLARPAFAPEVGAVVARLLAEAEPLYASAWPAIGRLPPRTRPAVRAALLIYRDIGRVIARRGYDSVSGRAWTGPGRKGWLGLRALIRRPGRLDAHAAPGSDPFRRARAAWAEAGRGGARTDDWPDGGIRQAREFLVRAAAG